MCSGAEMIHGNPSMKSLPLFVACIALPFLSSPAMAAPTFDEASIVKSVGSKITHKRSELDDGCRVTRYFFQDEPRMVMEFRCNRVNVVWHQYSDKGFAAKNKTAAALAHKAAAALSNGDGREVADAMQGSTVRSRPTPSGLTVTGSCVLPSCMLTYR
jgi:hypothetical protein